MIVLIIAIILSILITFLICYILPKEKVKQINQDLLKKEQELQLNIKDKEQEYNNLINKFESTRQTQENTLREDMRNWEKEKSDKNLNFLKAEMQLKENIASLETSIEEKKKSITELDSQSKKAIKSLEEQVIDNMGLTIEQQGKELSQRYETLESNLLLHYTELADTKQDEYITQCEELDNSILTKENLLDELTKKANAITESNRRAQLEREEKDFYRLQLSDLDITEIQKIRSIEPYLRNKEPLNKVIWKVYYEKPYNDLVGRVIGNKKKTGIYKITHLDTGKTYVGQSLDIAERFRQHIKRGIGADPPTQNKLYPAMLEYGAENFMFEVLEECDASKLSEREKYYTEIYQSNSFGFVVRKG